MRSVMMASLLQDLARFREQRRFGVFCLFHHKVLDACADEVRHRNPLTAQDKRKDGLIIHGVSGLAEGPFCRGRRTISIVHLGGSLSVTHVERVGGGGSYLTGLF